MTESIGNTPQEQSPFDETTQWSGPAYGDSHDPQALGDIIEPLATGQELPPRQDGFADEAERKLAANRRDAENWVRDAREQLADLIARKGSGEDISHDAISQKQQELLEAQMARHGLTPSWKL